MMEQHHHHQQQQQQQQQQMGSSGGGGGLSRFQSAPTTWFDTLLLEEDEEAQTQCLSQPPILRNSTIYDDPSTTTNTFFRHNSSPPELLSHLTSSLPPDSYFSTSGFSSNYDLLSIPDIRSEKRPKELESTQQLKVEKGADFSEMEMENLFQDSVPCRIRAKRGFATHPRSIAERVRRTRISDRIRKLQEIVPNMDKQTNTADMLDEAVEYVKLLQKQIQELTERQNKCKCSSRD